MSEYWKSLPRKFCDICKCWFADNKASIEFHERGKRHQENAQKQIKDIQKKGMKDFKKQKKYEDDMAKIERAAIAAYKKDLQNNSELTPNAEETIALASSNSNITMTEIKPVVHKPVKQKKEKTKKVEKKLPSKPVTKIWYEAVTDEGDKYYWNTENSESRWDPPEEGYVSIEKQSSTSDQIAAEDVKKEANDSDKKCFKKEVDCTFGPQPKVDPYGQWVTIEEPKPVEIDFQLPKPSEDIVEVIISIPKEERFKFKEKVIGQLSDTDPTEVTFKKRKFAGSSKRNARQRTTDD